MLFLYYFVNLILFRKKVFQGFEEKYLVFRLNKIWHVFTFSFCIQIDIAN